MGSFGMAFTFKDILAKCARRIRGPTLSELPPGFDSEIYYRLNEDVRKAGIDAAAHFLNWGRAEGRQWRSVAHFDRGYNAEVRGLTETLAHDEAMARAVGGNFDIIGDQLVEYLEKFAGLQDGMTVLDFGCGSGRLPAKLAASHPNCRYVGMDVVDDLLAHAKKLSPPSFVFLRNGGRLVTFPLADGSVDVIAAFSVFTHLTHDESYAYLEDALRVLKSGGRIALSILEFSRPEHWHLFSATIEARKAGPLKVMTTFIERAVLEVWTRRIGLKIESYQSYHDEFGQTFCIARKP
jgi:ubiquinone/menaquinone biosynthesis C-methylase UbiE